ncbi:MAG: ACP S-malonyltransferase [Spirochaetales bacterium]|nr:ACP S-malonyltransferase [Spirochaetales bacterium]
MKTCFLFPGQGAQYPGMGKDLFEANSKVKELFALASDSTGINMQKLLFEGTEEELKATDKTQIAITLVNLSAGIILKEKGIKPQGVAGFSLGEYSALCEAGVISLNDIFPIVKARGDIMEKVSRSLDSASGNPGMAAVIGLTYDQLQSAVDKNGLSREVFLANYNAPTQTVISGTYEGLNKAETVLKEAGARRIIRLKVSGPFHCPLLMEAGTRLKETIEKYSFSNPSLPVYSNVTGRKISSAEEAKQLCVDQITQTVRWVDEEESLVKDGYDNFLEVGPGKVLTGLLKQFSADLAGCRLAGTIEDINAIN